MAAAGTNLTECPNCSLEYTKSDRTPRLLPCTHTICFQCVLVQLDNNVKCPICNQQHRVFNGAKTFPVNEDKLEILKLKEQQTNVDKGTKPDGEDDKGKTPFDAEDGQQVEDKTHSNTMTILKVAGAGVIGAGAAVAAAPTVLGAAGFTSAGVAANSLAAWWMSVSAPIASGSLYASLQSAGAAGIGIAGNTIAAGLGGIAGTGLGAGVATFAEKFRKSENVNGPPGNDDNPDKMAVAFEDEGSSVDFAEDASKSKGDTSGAKIVTVITKNADDDDVDVNQTQNNNDNQVNNSDNADVVENIDDVVVDVSHSNEMDSITTVPIQCEEDLKEEPEDEDKFIS